MSVLTTNVLRARAVVAWAALACASACTPSPTGSAETGSVGIANAAPDLEEDEEVPVESDGDLVLPIPLDVPYDAARAALGERLFHDPLLSSDGTVSCASCHDLARGGADGNQRTDLPTRPAGPINVPTVLNVGLNFRWSWIGRWQLMADQIDAAMRADHAMDTTVEDATPGLRATYATDFERVYADGLTPDDVRDALTEYLRSLTTPNARFDRFLRGDLGALTDEEQRGWALFREVGCVTCHQGVNIGGNLFQRFGVVGDALPAVQTTVDYGRYVVTHDQADMHVFRVPSLRNVALTAPYFHNGSAETLEEAVQVMARFQLGRRLREEQVELLVAFLRTLTGQIPERRAP